MSVHHRVYRGWRSGRDCRTEVHTGRAELPAGQRLCRGRRADRRGKDLAEAAGNGIETRKALGMCKEKTHTQSFFAFIETIA